MKTSKLFLLITISMFLFSFSGQSRDITFILAGDINLVTKRPDYLRKFNLNINYYFEHIKNIVKRGDVNFCNLEQAVTDKPYKPKPYPGKAFVFIGSGRHLDIIKKTGFNVINLANNHILDYGRRGLYETIKSLNARNMKYFGAGLNEREARKPLIINIKGKKIAFFGYIMRFNPNFHARGRRAGCPSFRTYKTNSYYRGINKDTKNVKYQFKQDIDKVKNSVDIVAVSIHFGLEYHTHPAKFQIEAAREAIDAGANIVIGHHPHVIQKIEKYKQGIIFYSLGNLIFPSYFMDPYIMIAELKIGSNNKIKNVLIHPLVIKNRHDFNLCVDDYKMFMPYPAKGRWLKGFDYMLKERGFKVKFYDNLLYLRR